MTGSASESSLERKLREANVKASQYQGPTTVNVLISELAPKQDITTVTLLVHLPHYVQLEQDYSGQYRLLSTVNSLYDLSIDLSQTQQRGEEQYRMISQAVEANPEVRELVRTMETSYDEGVEERREPMPRLSPEVEEFLKDIEKRLDLD